MELAGDIFLPKVKDKMASIQITWRKGNQTEGYIVPIQLGVFSTATKANAEEAKGTHTFVHCPTTTFSIPSSSSMSSSLSVMIKSFWLY